MNQSGMMPEELRAELDDLFRGVPATRALGIELVSWKPGTSSLRLRTSTEHANLTDTVHGAVLFALADAAFEIACNSFGRVCVAIETSCHYLSPAHTGDLLVAVATEEGGGGRVRSYRIEVRGEDDTLRALYMALAYCTSRWHLGADRWPDGWRSQH